MPLPDSLARLTVLSEHALRTLERVWDALPPDRQQALEMALADRERDAVALQETIARAVDEEEAVLRDAQHLAIKMERAIRTLERRHREEDDSRASLRSAENILHDAASDA